ncbi:hypothetical protein [Variovorax sp. SRS16]|uniref:hypothetical protein n=1 Tax=Variovorax sp. SRS16 TaxID=282217 RepID=UPI0013A566ED|nr:hypothetical protein [Variovorax sp. SRS16]
MNSNIKKINGLQHHTRAVAGLANRHSVHGKRVDPLSRYFVHAPRERGLVLGFASVPEGEMLRPFERLVQVLRARTKR